MGLKKSPSPIFARQKYPMRGYFAAKRGCFGLWHWPISRQVLKSFGGGVTAWRSCLDWRDKIAGHARCRRYRLPHCKLALCCGLILHISPSSPYGPFCSESFVVGENLFHRLRGYAIYPAIWGDSWRIFCDSINIRRQIQKCDRIDVTKRACER